MNLYGEVHDARQCTFNNRSLWIASFCDSKGKFLFENGRYSHNVSEHGTREEALEWLRTEAQRRGLKLVILEASRWQN